MAEVSKEKTMDLFVLTQKSAKITVVSHQHPDGDAVGSLTAFGSFLRGVCGKSNVAMVLPDAAPAYLDFIAGGTGIIVGAQHPDEARAAILSCDLLVCIDATGPSRLGDLETAFRTSAARKVLIDHHLNPEADAFGLVFSETAVSSACELLYEILMLTPPVGGDASKLPADCAQSLMTGMTTDSNNFANSVFPGTLRMASTLLAAGVDRDYIIEKLYNEYRENRIRAFGSFLGNELKVLDNGLAYMVIRADRYREFALEEGETEGLVNVPLGIGKVRMSILLKEDDGFFRVSLRSKRGTEVRTLAAERFHGGGHAQASGGRLFFPGDIAAPEDAAAYVEDAAARFLQNEERNNDER